MLTELFAPVIDFISNLILTFNYFGIAFVTFLENIIAPIPSEFIFPWAGFLASQGKLNVVLIALSGAVGATIAAVVLYYLGTLFNGPKTKEFVDKYGKYLFIKNDDLEKAEKWFNKYGSFTVFFCRFIPLVRTLISVPAGFAKVNPIKFLVLTFAGSFIWCFILTYAGYLLGANWEQVSELLQKYEKVAILLLGIGFIGLAVWKIYTFKKPEPVLEDKV